MAIFICDKVPTFENLRAAGIDVQPEHRTDPRAARILLVSPKSSIANPPATDVQWATLLEGSRKPVHLTVITPEEFTSAIRADGMIMAGVAPEREDQELAAQKIIVHAHLNIPCGFYVCWAAQMALKYDYDVPTYWNEHKFVGLCPLQLNENPSSPLANHFHADLRRFGKIEATIHRHGFFTEEDIAKTGGVVETILHSGYAGPSVLCSADGRNAYLLEHIEHGCDRKEPPPWRPVAQTIMNRWLDQVDIKRAALSRAVTGIFDRNVFSHARPGATDVRVALG